MTESKLLRVDLLDHLTVVELDMCSRRLKEDVASAILSGTAGRWQGMALVCWIAGKRIDPTTALRPLLELPAGQLIDRFNELARLLVGELELLEELEDAEAALAAIEAEIEARGNDEGPNRSVSGPESSTDEAAEAGDEPANPTRPPTEPGSPGSGAPIPAGSAS